MAAPSVSNFDTPARDFDSLNEPVRSTSPTSSRKKKVNIENHQKYKKKKLLHSSEGKLSRINCAHQSARSFCKASTLTPDDVNYNFQKLYNCSSKVEQDAAILKLMDINQAKRARVTEAARQKPKALSVKYYMLRSQINVKVEVCKATFISVLSK